MPRISTEQLKQLVEAALFIADRPLSLNELQSTLLLDFKVGIQRLRSVIKELEGDYQGRGIHLIKVASGYRFQARDDLGPMLGKLWPERAPRYSRATLETLALIAYRQPITRGEIEDVRGVSVSSNIIRSLIERDWIKVVGHKEVPGRPALYATTSGFLDYFCLQSLEQLPPLEEISLAEFPMANAGDGETIQE